MTGPQMVLILAPNAVHRASFGASRPPFVRVAAEHPSILETANRVLC